MPTSIEKHDQKIIQIASKAMKLQKPLQLEYDGLPRLVEVHCIGISKAGRPSLRVYQTEGETLRGDSVGWKLLTIGKILSPPKLIDAASFAPREGYQPNDLGMVEIIDQL